MILLLGSGLLPRIFIPEIVARKLVIKQLKDYIITEMITIPSFKLRTGIDRKFCTFEGINWKAVEIFAQQNDLTANELRQLICNSVNTPAIRGRQETNLRRLKQRLFQVDFPENP